jgi:hypothetical protein
MAPKRQNPSVSTWDMHDAGAAPVQIATPPTRLRGPEDYPPIGSMVRGRVLGYSGDQLRLTLREG